MDEKISLQAVEEYSVAFSSKIADEYFAQHQKISGADILKLCQTKQINLFVLRELLKAWKQEAAKYKSPYFDYESQDVKDSLTQFQNSLSNNISIAKDHFLPLLKKGVSLTVYLVLDPYDFYSDTLDKNGSGTIKIAELKNEIKYIKINHRPLERLIQKLEEKKMHSISGNEAFALLDQILEEVNFTPEDVEPYIQQLSAVLPLEMEKLYGKKAEAINTPAKKQNTPRPTINEQSQKEPVTTVADDFQRITDLQNRLTINQKFMFTKMLFNGDFDLFNDAITKIDSLVSLDEATSYLDSHYSNWDRESEEYEEFMEMVMKRFA
ncbi:MAG: hypothetical protein WAU36_14625 [Cyclobacteriaceae bacterium]